MKHNKFTKGSSLFGIVRGSYFERVGDQEISHPYIDDELFFPVADTISSSFLEIKAIFTNETFRFTITRAIPFIHKDGTR